MNPLYLLGFCTSLTVHANGEAIKSMELLKQIRAIGLLPVMVIIVIPTFLIYLTSSIRFGWFLPSPFNIIPIFVGIFLITIGLIFCIKSTFLLAIIGKGTLAPWDPKQKLVVEGVYRYVRNPMIIGIFLILLGEAMLFGSIFLFYWFIIFFIGNLIYIPLFEEPSLEKRFGKNFILYKKNVPRWIPRQTPWDGPLGYKEG
ncbi:MAG: isoprenylcysteine carboxylmethyltransferase family protein [Candidatus Bathyarchaeota archaeon]|nr:isoprenylcysteine carboxylmethyltransferase family protein [Candidatus Bathyarchaeota archaeon]